MTHQEKLVLLRDLLIVRGVYTNLREEMGNAWISALHRHHWEAAKRLAGWLHEPVVAVAIYNLSMDEHPALGVHVNLRHLLCTAGPRVGVPLFYAATFDPDDEARSDAVAQWHEVLPEDKPTPEECELMAMVIHRAKQLKDDPVEEIREMANEYLVDHADQIAGLPPFSRSEVCELSRRALYSPTLDEQLAAVRSVLATDPSLGNCLLLRASHSQPMIQMTVDEATDLGVPKPPLNIENGGKWTVRVRDIPRPLDGKEALIAEMDVAVRHWLEADILSRNFEQLEPEATRAVEILVGIHRTLKKRSMDVVFDHLGGS